MTPGIVQPPTDPPPHVAILPTALYLLTNENIATLHANPTLTLQVRQATVAVCAADISAASIDAVLSLNPSIVLLGYMDVFAEPGWGVGNPFWDTVRNNLAGCRYAGNLVPQDYPVPQDPQHCLQYAIRPAPKNAVRVVQTYHAVMDRRLHWYVDQAFAIEPDRYVSQEGGFAPAWCAGENIPASFVDQSYREARASYLRTIAIYAKALRPDKLVYANTAGWVWVGDKPEWDSICIEGRTSMQRSALQAALEWDAPLILWDAPPSLAVPGLLLAGVRI